MKTTISSKGQLVIPLRVRNRLKLKPGDTLDARVSGGSVVLTPAIRRGGKSKIITDPITKLPVMTPPQGANPAGIDELAALLADFP